MSGLQFAECITANVKAGVWEDKVIQDTYDPNDYQSAADFADSVAGIAKAIKEIDPGEGKRTDLFIST